MNITILNGDMSNDENKFTSYIISLSEKLNEQHNVNLYTLNDMNLHYCTGCWNCWWKTPGECTTKDGAEEIFTSYINSDFTIFASPIMQGFTSSALKKITDRFVCLLHPYIELKQGETHHKKRYDKYPDFGLILQKENDTDKEDIMIISDIYDRLALNFHCEKRYLKFSDKHDIEEIAYETSSAPI